MPQPKRHERSCDSPARGSHGTDAAAECSRDSQRTLRHEAEIVGEGAKYRLRAVRALSEKGRSFFPFLHQALYPFKSNLPVDMSTVPVAHA